MWIVIWRQQFRDRDRVFASRNSIIMDSESVCGDYARWSNTHLGLSHRYYSLADGLEC